MKQYILYNFKQFETTGSFAGNIFSGQITLNNNSR